eukprot:403352310
MFQNALKKRKDDQENEDKKFDSFRKGRTKLYPDISYLDAYWRRKQLRNDFSLSHIDSQTELNHNTKSFNTIQNIHNISNSSKTQQFDETRSKSSLATNYNIHGNHLPSILQNHSQSSILKENKYFDKNKSNSDLKSESQNKFLKITEINPYSQQQGYSTIDQRSNSNSRSPKQDRFHLNSNSQSPEPKFISSRNNTINYDDNEFRYQVQSQQVLPNVGVNGFSHKNDYQNKKILLNLMPSKIPYNQLLQLHKEVQFKQKRHLFLEQDKNKHANYKIGVHDNPQSYFTHENSKFRLKLVLERREQAAENINQRRRVLKDVLSSEL